MLADRARRSALREGTSHRTTSRWKAPIFLTSGQSHPLDALRTTKKRTILVGQEIPLDFPPPSSIKPHQQFLSDNPHAQLLISERLNLDQLHQIEKPFTTRGLVGIGATIPAAIRHSHPYPEKAYEKHAWIRDAVVGLEALINAQQIEKATLVLEEILTFLSLPSQRNRIVEYHFASSCRGAPHDHYLNDVARRAYIRAPIGRNGTLAEHLTRRNGNVIEDGQHWAHDQLGSFGQLIRLACLGHQSGKFDLRKIYHNVIRRIESSHPDTAQHLSQEHILVSLQKFLYRISIVEGENNEPQLSIITRGAWEETPALNRTSELVPLLAAVEEFLVLYSLPNNPLQLAGDRRHRQEFIDNLQTFSTLLRLRVDEQIPSIPGKVARESVGLQGLDSVVALLLSPRLIKLTALQQFAIVRTVLRNMGIGNEYGVLDAPGIIRYRGDEYTAGDMHLRADINWNVAHATSHAHWTLFDPALAAHFFMRAHELATQAGTSEAHRALGIEYYTYGCKFLQRSASQVFPKGFHGKMPFAGSQREHTVFYAPYDPVEAFYFQSDTGRWAPNTNCLNWTNSQRAMMFHWAKVAARQYTDLL